MRINLFLLGGLLLAIASCTSGDENPPMSCNDGIQNQGETDIDCGGPCASCTERDKVVVDYNANYLGSNVTNPGWTGSANSCDPGTVPQTTHDNVIKRINYFRRLVGLNDDTTLDESKFGLYQETALMMSANGQLDHFPPDTWSCYTQDGYDGATTSNLSLGNHSTGSVTAFMRDAGASNFDVGHRRWILHSRKTEFSYGTTNGAMALGVIGVANGNTEIPPFIAYPAKGYMPQSLAYPRWSFGIPGANFSSANVTMSGPEGNIPLTIVSTTANYGDRTIVWEPQGIITNSENDVSYEVTVSGITNAPQASYTYTVIIIKP